MNQSYALFCPISIVFAARFMHHSVDLLDADILAPLAAHYKSNVVDFTLELRQMKRMIERKTNDKTMPTFDDRCDELFAFFVSRYDEAF